MRRNVAGRSQTKWCVCVCAFASGLSVRHSFLLALGMMSVTAPTCGRCSCIVSLKCGTIYFTSMYAYWKCRMEAFGFAFLIGLATECGRIFAFVIRISVFGPHQSNVVKSFDMPNIIVQHTAALHVSLTHLAYELLSHTKWHEYRCTTLKIAS